MAGKTGRKRGKVRGNPEKAQFPSSLAEIRVGDGSDLAQAPSRL